MLACENVLPLEEWQRLRSQILWCYQGCPPLAGGVTPFRTANYSAWLVLRGRAVLYVRGEAREYWPGNWIIVPPPGYQRSFIEGTELLSIHFRFVWADDLDLFTLPEPVSFPSAPHPTLERAVRRVLRWARSFGTTGTVEAITRHLNLEQYLHFQTLAGRFVHVLTRTLEAEGLLPAACCTRVSPRLGQILGRLRDLPLDRPWNSAGTARGLNMSAGHFARVFRREYGQTPRRYFDTRRLEHAKQEIVAGRVSIKEVAAGLGFSSAVFCRWFRQNVGASPSLYRRNVASLRTG